MRSKSEQRRVHILQVAAATFTELGVENATMSDILERLGGSKSTIYSYFPSKAELVQAVVTHASEIELQSAFTKLDPATAPGAMLRQFGRTYLAQLLTPGMLSAMRIAQQDGARSDNGRRFYEGGPRIGWELMQVYLEHHIALGTLIECAPWTAAMHLKGLLQSEWLDRVMFGEAAPDTGTIEQAADRAVDAFLRAYLKR
jgi:AcrR family transcriptional regulator